MRLRSKIRSSPRLWLLMLPPLILSGVLYFVTMSAQQSSDLAVRRDSYIAQLRIFLSTLTDAETSQRGYLLTGQGEYLDSYNLALRQVPSLAARVDALTRQSAAFAATPKLARLSAAKLEELRRTVELSRKGDHDAALAIVKDNSGTILMNQIRAEVERLRQTQIEAASLDRARRDRLRGWTIALLVAVPFLTAAMIWRLVSIAQRETRLRDLKEHEIENMNRQLETRIAERTAVLQDANKDLEEFARSAAHDLRSPVRTATTMVQLVQRRFHGHLPDEASSMLRMASDGLQRLGCLVDELLSYQRLALSEVPPLESVDLRRALGEAETSLKTLLDESCATLRMGELPHVLGHPGQLARLFQNLIENAVKFRRLDRALTIEVSAAASGTAWIVSVRDNGMGFDPEHSVTIFKPFRRLHGPEVPGSGIGLALCARIAERCGGRIWAESIAGKGSVFHVQLQAAILRAERDRTHAAAHSV